MHPVSRFLWNGECTVVGIRDTSHVSIGKFKLNAFLSIVPLDRFPVVSVGVIRWVECIVTEPTFFSLSTDYCPVQLALLDEVVTCHPLLHSQVLEVSLPSSLQTLQRDFTLS